MKERWKFSPEVGTIYENHGGGTFKCLSVSGYNATFKNTKSGWTFLHMCATSTRTAASIGTIAPEGDFYEEQEIPLELQEVPEQLDGAGRLHGHGPADRLRIRSLGDGIGRR